MSRWWRVYASPLGPLTLVGGERGLRTAGFPGRAAPGDERLRWPEAPVLEEAARQLEEYFAGERRAFALPLDLEGTRFQRRVWSELLGIGFGRTVDYTTLAGALGRTDRVRAVAAAVGRTPVPIVVPCHRVVGRDGALTGYGGGLHRKAALLDLERRVADGGEPEPAWTFRQLALM